MDAACIEAEADVKVDREGAAGEGVAMQGTDVERAPQAKVEVDQEGVASEGATTQVADAERAPEAVDEEAKAIEVVPKDETN